MPGGFQVSRDAAWLAAFLLVAVVFMLSVFMPTNSVVLVISGEGELPPGYRDYVLVASVAESPGPGHGVPPVVTAYAADPVPLGSRDVYSSRPAIGVLVFSGPVLSAALSMLVSAVALLLAFKPRNPIPLALVVAAALVAAYAVASLWLGVESRSYTFKYEVTGIRKLEIPSGEYYLLVSVEGTAGVQLKDVINETLINSSRSFHVRLNSPETLTIFSPTLLGGSAVYISIVYEPRLPDATAPLLASQVLSLAGLVSAATLYSRRTGPSSGTQV